MFLSFPFPRNSLGSVTLKMLPCSTRYTYQECRKIILISFETSCIAGFIDWLPLDKSMILIITFPRDFYRRLSLVSLPLAQHLICPWTPSKSTCSILPRVLPYIIINIVAQLVVFQTALVVFRSYIQISYLERKRGLKQNLGLLQKK